MQVRRAQVQRIDNEAAEKEEEEKENRVETDLSLRRWEPRPQNWYVIP